MNFLKINGAYGEGGGQIVRSAITLSCITNQPIHLENIRKNRKNEGLKPQHLTAIKILKKISNAKVIGDTLGSTELKFIPGEIKNLELIEDVKTAGSISLILQVLIPAVSISQKKLSLIIKGGTDVMWSPTMNYTKYVLKEAYSRMGIKFEIQITKRGYYPKGEGEIKVEVFPSEIKSIKLSKRKKQKLQLKCSFSKIPIQVIEKKIDVIKEEVEKHNFEIEIEMKEDEASDSGSSVLIYSVDENSIIGIDGLFNKKTQNFDLDLNKIIEAEIETTTLIGELNLFLMHFVRWRM